MPRTFNLIESEVADAIRRAVRRRPIDGDLRLIGTVETGVFQPIKYFVATGRSRCRACGEKIPQHQVCVAFELDLYVKRFGKWGHLVTAYLHTNCEKEEA